MTHTFPCKVDHMLVTLRREGLAPIPDDAVAIIAFFFEHVVKPRGGVFNVVKVPKGWDPNAWRVGEVVSFVVLGTDARGASAMLAAPYVPSPHPKYNNPARPSVGHLLLDVGSIVTAP